MTDFASLGIEVKTAQLKRGERALDQFTRKAANTERKVKRSTDRMSAGFKLLAASAGAAFAAFGSARAVRSIIETGSRFEDLRSQLATLTGSANNAAAAFETIRTTAARTPISVARMSQSFNLLLANGISPTADRLLQMADISAAFTSNTDVAFRTLTESMQRAIAGGAIFVEDLERLDNVGIAATKTLQDLYGVQRHEIADLNTTAGFAEEAILRLYDTLGARAAGASESRIRNISTLMSNFRDEVDAASETFTQGFKPGLEDAITLVREFIADHPAQIRALGEFSSDVLKGMVNAVQTIASYQTAIGYVSAGLGGLLGISVVANLWKFMATQVGRVVGFFSSIMRMAKEVRTDMMFAQAVGRAGSTAVLGKYLTEISSDGVTYRKYTMAERAGNALGRSLMHAGKFAVALKASLATAGVAAGAFAIAASKVEEDMQLINEHMNGIDGKSVTFQQTWQANVSIIKQDLVSAFDDAGNAIIRMTSKIPPSWIAWIRSFSNPNALTGPQGAAGTTRAENLAVAGFGVWDPQVDPLNAPRPDRWSRAARVQDEIFNILSRDSDFWNSQSMRNASIIAGGQEPQMAHGRSRYGATDPRGAGYWASIRGNISTRKFLDRSSARNALAERVDRTLEEIRRKELEALQWRADRDEAFLAEVNDHYDSIAEETVEVTSLVEREWQSMLKGVTSGTNDITASVSTMIRNLANDLEARVIDHAIGQKFRDLMDTILEQVFAAITDRKWWEGGAPGSAQSGLGDLRSAFADFWSSGTVPSFSGGGYTGNGARVGGLDGRGGFPAILHPRETVSDHAMGGGGFSVVINNNAGVEVTAVQTDGGRELEISIDKQVAQALQNGPRTNAVLKNTHGVSRQAR